MSIRVTCTCGEVLEAPDELEGKYARCPACGAELLVADPASLEVQGLADTGTEAGVRCARCGEQLPHGLMTCPSCGGNPYTGAGPAAKVGLVSREEPEEIGFFRLCLGMLIHPVHTSNELVPRLSYPDMLLKTGALLLVSALIWQLCLLAVRRGEGGLQEALAGVVVLTLSVVSSAFFVAVVGRIIGGQWLFLATSAGFAFMKGVVLCVAFPLVLGLAVGLLSEALVGFVVLLVWVWAWVLKLLVIDGVFGCGIGVAFLINFLAGVLEAVVFVVLGFPVL